MSDVQINEKDPYEYYRVGQPVDVNDPSFKTSALVGADKNGGKDLPVMNHVSSDKLKELAEQSEGKLSDRNKHQQEYMREVLETHGIHTRPTNGRKYF